jgi:hypothetical protein
VGASVSWAPALPTGRANRAPVLTSTSTTEVSTVVEGWTTVTVFGEKPGQGLPT